MFQELHAEIEGFKPPWERESISQRFGVLLEFPGRLCVAYLYDTTDSSTFRYRVYNMIEILHNETECDWHAAWLAPSEVYA